MENKKISQNAGDNSIQISDANKVVISNGPKPIPAKVIKKREETTITTYIPDDDKPPLPPDLQPKNSSDASDESIIGCGVLLLIIIGIVIGYFLFKPRSTKVLEAIETYTFEKGLSSNFRALGNSSLSIEPPGLSGDKSLKVNLLLSPEVPGNNQGGFFINLPDKPKVKAISMFVYLPDTSMAAGEPIYMKIIAIGENGVSWDYSYLQLKPGYWMPLFLGVHPHYWNSPLKLLQAWVVRNAQPYLGTIYIDELTFYDTVHEVKIAPSQTPFLPVTPSP